MEINYFLATTISILGLVCGLIISYIAKEELVPGRRHFIRLHDALASLIIAVILLSFNIRSWFAVITAIIVFMILSLIRNTKKVYITYPALAIIMFISERYPKYFFITASLFFIFGFPTASLIILDQNKKKK